MVYIHRLFFLKGDDFFLYKYCVFVSFLSFSFWRPLICSLKPAVANLLATVSSCLLSWGTMNMNKWGFSHHLVVLWEGRWCWWWTTVSSLLITLARTGPRQLGLSAPTAEIPLTGIKASTLDLKFQMLPFFSIHCFRLQWGCLAFFSVQRSLHSLAWLTLCLQPVLTSCRQLMLCWS